MIIPEHSIKKPSQTEDIPKQTVSSENLSKNTKNLEAMLKTAERKGYELAQTEVKNTLNILNKLSQNLVSRLKTLTEDIKPELISFCIHICETIMFQKLKDAEFIKTLIENIIKTSFQVNEQVSRIILSKQDFDILFPLIQHNKISIGYQNTWEADTSLSPGSYKIHTSDKLVSYHFQEELFLLKQNLLNNV